MAFAKKEKSWQLSVSSGGADYYGLLLYTYSSNTWTLTPTDNVYTPITISLITAGYTHLLAQARTIIAGEVLGVSPTYESDLTDRLGYMNDTVEIQFFDAVPAVVWTISELVEPEHFQAIKALITKYLNDLTNIT
jgi:hypothetical protein